MFCLFLLTGSPRHVASKNILKEHMHTINLALLILDFMHEFTLHNLTNILYIYMSALQEVAADIAGAKIDF